MRKLFTERVAQPEPRVKETLEDAVQIALLQLVEQRIDDCSVPIRFSPTPPTCRVLPFPGVKFIVGWGGGCASDAEK
jgi:hypothetical protein